MWVLKRSLKSQVDLFGLIFRGNSTLIPALHNVAIHLDVCTTLFFDKSTSVPVLILYVTMGVVD